MICFISQAQVPTYKIDKIKRLRNHFVIYAISNDTTYKIVSDKQKIIDCKKIKKNKCYPLKFKKVQSLAGSEIDCFSFDENTVICKEPDIDLYIATNLKGLCLTK